MKPDDPRHGTANGYSNLKCRCAPCTAAWAEYHRQWVSRKPASRREHRRRERLRRGMTEAAEQRLERRFQKRTKA
jgi:hypothetical protein